MNRRIFLGNVGIAAAAIQLTRCYTIGAEVLEKTHEKIKPPKLNPGDTIGLITPGSSITESELQDSIKNVESLGFNVYYTENILAKNGYLAGTDKHRADDINYMFENDDVKGIMCARGGYGCNRILPMIDYTLIRKNPKVLVGYSDVTALLYAIYAQTGLVSFHGPVGVSTFNDYSVNYLKKVLMETNKFNIEIAEEDIQNENEAYHSYTITPGIAEGELVGGNLSIAASLLGTPYDVCYKNKILYLEDVGEEPYRIDRMLTELILAGKLEECAAIVLGVFINCEIKKDDPSFKDSFRLREVFEDRLKPLGIPAAYGFSFGHIKNKFTVPFGVKARVDTELKSISIMESCVI